MKITVPKLDLRRDTNCVEDESGNLVGQILLAHNLGRTIKLFGKYGGNYRTEAECQAFADGVVAVLNHMMTTEPEGAMG